MKDTLILGLKNTLTKMGVQNSTIKIEYPEEIAHGDYSTNVAMAYAKQLGTSPRALAEKIVADLQVAKIAGIQSIEIAGPGFINFNIEGKVVTDYVVEKAKASLVYKTKDTSRKHILIEHTDPNAFKAFHIGHLMANAIGESLSRLVGTDGSKVTKMCYPSDIGLHIAKSIWAMKQHESDIPKESTPIIEKTTFLGKMYVEGTQKYETDPAVKAEIDSLNRIIYERSDKKIVDMYEMGKKWSMDHYELLYKRLGTTFDEYIYESEVAESGKSIVMAHMDDGIFEKSEGAVVFKGEQYGLHTRVFLNSVGLTTYEAKDIGLNTKKFEKYPDIDESIIVTASEQNDYFKVIKKVLTLIDENIGNKTTHIGHGMMRFASGKMSSRTGNVITAENLIDEIKAMVIEKIKDREFSDTEKDVLADEIAIGAIKYTILRQSVGSDIIFDSAASISFEGDSGPYLQYAAVRAHAILKKAKEAGIHPVGRKGILTAIFGLGTSKEAQIPKQVTHFEKVLTRFPDTVERARADYAPQLIANYLTMLAGEFNSFYAKQVIVDVNDPLSSYYVTVTQVFYETMKEGLWLLGIKVPERM